MKRYTREEMSDESKLDILSKLGTVIEIVGTTARVGLPSTTVPCSGGIVEIPMAWWYELKEAE